MNEEKKFRVLINIANNVNEKIAFLEKLKMYGRFGEDGFFYCNPEQEKQIELLIQELVINK